MDEKYNNNSTNESTGGQDSNGAYSGQTNNNVSAPTDNSVNGQTSNNANSQTNNSVGGQTGNETYSGQTSNGAYSGQNGSSYGQSRSYTGQGYGSYNSYSGQGNYGYGNYGTNQNAGNTYGSQTGTGASSNSSYGSQTGNGSYSSQSGSGAYGSSPYINNGVPSGNGGSGKKHNKKHHISGKFMRMVALVLAGILVGSLVTYGFSRGRAAASAQNEESSSESEKATLHKSDDSDVVAKADENAGKDDTSKDTSKKSDSAENTVQTTGTDSEMSVSEIATKCMPCVVAITNKGTTEIRSMWGNFTQDSESSGSGVIIGETDSELLILTNYHVIEGSKSLSVVFSWEDSTDKDDANSADIITAQVKDYDESNDIAVISIPMSELSEDTKNKISVATVGDSKNLELGQQIVAIGNALGYGQSITTGIISALDREIEIQNDSGNTVTNKYIQTDAAINPGNSGGAMFNMKGELVGINSAKISSDSIEGMGYAIPISDIMDKVETMMNQETKAVVEESKRGYLGVSIVDVTSDISSAYGMPQGVYISAVTTGSGAEAAGLTKGDIITGINGKTVTTTSELKNYLSYYAVGDNVTITIERQGDSGYVSKSVDVKLSAAPAESSTSEETQDSQNSLQQIQPGSGNQGQSGDNSENDIQQFFFGGQGN